MADKEPSSAQALPINATAILALLTVVGGLVAASHRLSSDRPLTSPGRPNEEISEQMINTRLWEDPFTGSQKEVPTNSLGDLLRQLARKETSSLQLLPVMIPGGPSGEAQEQRLRSRFVIVSALAESGYVPENPEHIGIAQMRWHSTLELETNSNSCACTPQMNNTTATVIDAPGSPNGCSRTLIYPFEWYVQEAFVRHPGKQHTNNPVLVLWLDEDEFHDDPIKRLDLFLQALMPNWPTNSPPKITIVGPSLSSTLRAMFAGVSETNQATGLPTYQPLRLKQASLFLATPRAIDEVLIRTNAASYGSARSAVRDRLKQFFGDSKNFAATDSDLAGEVLKELQSRGIDLTRSNRDHLVLLADWDNFFGRMVSAAYAAELDYNQTRGHNRPTFLEDYRSGHSLGPTNLHTFFYLSGLDGQALSRSSDATTRRGDDKSRAQAEGSPQTRQKSWTPDINKAEGPAQFDYLGRLANRISDLQQELQRAKRGTVSAIGIAGGDVYDTLLILQALRPRFPNAVFFTSTLDARFWEPKELHWTRNLLVVSGYGLELHPDLQGDVPPFRSSLQTAQFAATLAALGNTNLLTLTDLPVRRFEIGRSGPVDLSDSRDPEPTLLHPVVQPAPHFWQWLAKGNHTPLLVTALATALLLATLLSKYFRRLTVERYQFLAEPLWLGEEDLGGVEGFLKIARHPNNLGCDPGSEEERLQATLRRIIANVEKFADRSSNTEPRQRRESLTKLLLPKAEATPADDRSSAVDNPQDRALVQTVLHEFLDVWNRALGSENCEGPAALSTGSTIEGPTRDWHAIVPKIWPPNLITSPKQLDRLQTNRLRADDLIERLLGPEAGVLPEREDDFTVEWAAKAARRVSWKLHELHSLRLWFARWSTLSLGLLGMVMFIFSLTDPSGVFFSLSGTSVWPSTWLCFLVLVLSVVFLTESYFRLRGTVLATTRRCRLCYEDREFSRPTQSREITWRVFRRAQAAVSRWVRSITLPPSCQPFALVEASRAWSAYQQKGHGQRRFWRSLGLAAAYFILINTVFLLVSGHNDFTPIRGTGARCWYLGVMLAAFVSVLFLSFWTIDAACLCRWFIQCISQGPTIYPLSTRRHFARLCGKVPEHILADWIDVRIIAEITERVGRLIYFPVVAFSLLILAHHKLFYNWPWVGFGYVIAACNLTVAAASIVILQRAARRARDASATSLEEKLHALRAAADVTIEDTKKRSVDEAQRLLDEIKGLNTGAFAGFWGNPVVGALLLPTGGTALIELIHLYLLPS